MSRGNVQWELNNSVPNKAASTSKLTVIAESADGIILCYSAITASATLSGLCADGITRFAYGCQCICVHTDAVATVLTLQNFGTATAPSFYCTISAGVEA
jgi:hypothetical protein